MDKDLSSVSRAYLKSQASGPHTRKAEAGGSLEAASQLSRMDKPQARERQCLYKQGGQHLKMVPEVIL